MSMVDILTIRSQRAIDMINQQIAQPGGYKFCYKLVKDREEFDTSPFDDYMKGVAQSPVFETFADSNNNSDCNGMVDQFLLENTDDSPETEEPFIESFHAFGVSNDIAMDTVELYKGTQTDMFGDVGHKTKSANKTKSTKSDLSFELEPTDGLFLVVAYFRETRHCIIQEMKEDCLRFSPEKLDVSFLRMVGNRVSTERLGHSFQNWFLQTFTIFSNTDDQPKSKVKTKHLPLVEYQYKALLIVYAIALTEVDEKYKNLIDFIYLLFPEESIDPVWQCVAIILFGLPECKASHHLDLITKSMKNEKRFRNDILGKSKGGSGNHSLTIKRAKMLKKVACMAVYQIGAFAFVRDVDLFLDKCSPHPAWNSVIVRLQDQVYDYVISAVSDHSPEENIDVPSLVRSIVLEATGYVVLCKFLVLTVNTVAKVVSTTDSKSVVKASPKQRDQQRRTQSPGITMPLGEYPSVPDEPVLLPVMDDGTHEITVLQPIVEAALKPIFEKTLQDLERVLKDLFGGTFGLLTTMSCRVASATANNVRTLGEKTKAHASTKKRDSTSSEKPAAAVFSVKAASKKQARVSMKKPSPATGSLGKRASALSKKPAPAVSSGKQDSAYLEKPAAADSRKRASTSSEKSSPVSKKKPNTNRISAILEVEEVQRQEVNPMLKLFYPGGAEAQKKI